MPESPPPEWFASGVIDPRKFDAYLLNPLHPLGKHKARLWKSVFGLDEKSGRVLETLIRAYLWQAEPKEMFGRYARSWELVIPRFAGPNGNVGPVLTAWAFEPHRDRPHLTTAYPIVGEEGTMGT